MGGLLVCYIWYSEEAWAWAGCGPAHAVPHRCIKYHSPPINAKCSNFILFDMALY